MSFDRRPRRPASAPRWRSWARFGRSIPQLGAADYKLVHHARNGRGVYSFCMASVAESYMVLAMAARLFLAEPQSDRPAGWELVLVDAILITLKPYSVIFIVLTWPMRLTCAPRGSSPAISSITF